VTVRGEPSRAAAWHAEAGGAKADLLTPRVKLAFAAPAFAGAAMGIAIGVLLPRFYSDVVLAPLSIIAVAIAAARSFDALTDPLMGWVSDRTWTRWGRRKPFLALGGPFVAITFYLLFAPPETLTPGQACVWFAAAFTLFFLFTTIVQVPYGALGAELTSGYRERSSLFGYRAMFIAAGLIAGAVVPVFLGGEMGIGDERARYRVMAALYAAALITLGILLLMGVRERPEYFHRSSNPLVPGIRRAMRNRPFRILLLAGAVHAVPIAIPSLLMPYFVSYVLQPEDSGTWIGIFLSTYLVAGLCFVPLWMTLARRVGKLPTLVVASVIGITASVFFFFAGPGRLLFTGCIYLVTGAISMVNNFLVPAMLADVIDYDELRNGKRREAQYMAFIALIPKFVAIPGSSIPLAILAAVGYVPNQPQTPEVLFWIRFMYSVFPASFYVVALLIVARYPISEAVHTLIRQGIDLHRAGLNAVDPITDRLITPGGTGRVGEADGWFLDYFAPRELLRTLRNGGHRLVAGVFAAAAVSLLTSVGAALAAIGALQHGDSSPAPTAVLAVVVAGVAFTAFLYHGLRLLAARRLVRQPLPAGVVRAHLENEIG